MKKSIGSVFLVFVFLTVFLNGCAPAPTPTPVPPAFTPSSIPPTFTPEPTSTATPVPETRTPIPTAAFTLECSLTKADLQQAHPANVYAVTGELVGSGNPEVAALQVDILGESGQITSSGSVSTEVDSFFNLNVIINDKWTYSESKHVYKVIGAIVYDITDFQKISSYTITASGEGFGTRSQTCKYP